MNLLHERDRCIDMVMRVRHLMWDMLDVSSALSAVGGQHSL
jgi:hypothetical protein